MRNGCLWRLLAACGEAEVFAEERHDMILKAVCHSACMRAVVLLEAVGNSILVKECRGA
jgi:hypothetical protein